MKYITPINKTRRNNIQRLKREIILKGKLNGFEETLEKLLQTIFDAGCDISCCDICENSSIEQSIDDFLKPHIRIGFKTARENSIHIIWDILHEFGHHLSGKADGEEKTLERERVAWDLGLKQLFCFPELTGYVDNYKNYRDKCLKTYNLHDKTESKT